MKIGVTRTIDQILPCHSDQRWWRVPGVRQIRSSSRPRPSSGCRRSNPTLGRSPPISLASGRSHMRRRLLSEETRAGPSPARWACPSTLPDQLPGTYLCQPSSRLTPSRLAAGRAPLSTYSLHPSDLAPAPRQTGSLYCSLPDRAGEEQTYPGLRASRPSTCRGRPLLI
jgi:hypothetical protein